MTYQESLQEQQKTWDFLKTVDIYKYIRTGDTIHEVMDRLMNQYGEWLFNCIDEFDFMEWLYEEHGIRSEEVSYYRIISY